MRKIKEVMRLRFELKLGYQQIGRSCAIAVSTVHKYLKRAEDALSWPLPEGWDEARADATLFLTNDGEKPGAYAAGFYRLTGQAWPAPLFVAALGASSYTYAEATRDQQMESLLRR